MKNKPREIVKLDRYAWILSGLVFIMVLLMRRVKLDVGIDFSFLPPVHATLNAIAALFLLIGLYFIKSGNAHKHRICMVSAMILSVLFLLSYVTYHFTTEETLFGGEGAIRYIYFFLLITHVVLAAIILPFILFTFIRAFTGHFGMHKKLARWVYPLWLYVAITGPVLYLMLAPYYGNSQ